MSSRTRVNLWLSLAFLPGLFMFAASLWATGPARGEILLLALALHVAAFAAIGLALYYTILRPLPAILERAQGIGAGADSQLPINRAAGAELSQLGTALVSLENQLATQRAALTEAEQRHTKSAQEIHHRIKNNLQIVSSLLSLQATRLKVPAGRVDFDMARQRLSALALLHRHLYDGKISQAIELRSFCSDLVEHLRELVGYERTALIRTHQNVPVQTVSADQAMLIGLIITETVSNAFRHAFPGNRPGNIELALSVENGLARLTVSDDGIGLPEGRLAENGANLGGLLVAGFVRQLRGTLRITNHGGTRLEIEFPLDPVEGA